MVCRRQQYPSGDWRGLSLFSFERGSLTALTGRIPAPVLERLAGGLCYEQAGRLCAYLARRGARHDLVDHREGRADRSVRRCASKALAVGAVVPYGAGRTGVLATQALANPFFGVDGLKILHEGYAATKDAIVVSQTAKVSGYQAPARRTRRRASRRCSRSF